MAAQAPYTNLHGVPTSGKSVCMFLHPPAKARIIAASTITVKPLSHD